MYDLKKIIFIWKEPGLTLLYVQRFLSVSLNNFCVILPRLNKSIDG